MDSFSDCILSIALLMNQLFMQIKPGLCNIGDVVCIISHSIVQLIHQSFSDFTTTLTAFCKQIVEKELGGWEEFRNRRSSGREPLFQINKQHMLCPQRVQSLLSPSFISSQGPSRSSLPSPSPPRRKDHFLFCLCLQTLYLHPNFWGQTFSSSQCVNGLTDKLYSFLYHKMLM